MYNNPGCLVELINIIFCINENKLKNIKFISTVYLY